MIAMQGMQIGRLAGQLPKKIGAVTMRAKAVHKQPEDVREQIRFVCPQVVQASFNRWRMSVMLQCSTIVLLGSSWLQRCCRWVLTACFVACACAVFRCALLARPVSHR